MQTFSKMPGLTVKEAFDDYKYLLESGETLKAMDLFYADKIVHIENSSEPLVGKDFLNKTEIENQKDLKDITFEVNNAVIDEENGKVWGEMIMKFKYKGGPESLLKEAFYQEWENGKIRLIRFYYYGIEEIEEE